MEFAAQFSPAHRDLLLHVSLLVGARRTIDEIFADFAKDVGSAVPFDFASLFVVTADPKFARTVGNFPHIPGASSPGTIVRLRDVGGDLMALEGHGAEYRPDKFELPATRALVEEGFKRCWATPLWVDGTNYGLLTVAKKAPGRFEEAHLAFLRAAAVLLGTAVRQDIELDHARRTAARATAANDLIVALQAGEPVDNIFQRLPAMLADCLDVDYIGLFLDDNGVYETVAEAPFAVFAGLSPEPNAHVLARTMAGEQNFVQSTVGEGDLYRELLGRHGMRRAALAFLRRDGEPRGIVILARRTERRFDRDESAFIEMLRALLSQALENQDRLRSSQLAAARARTLNEVGLLLNAGETVDAIFQRLTGLLGEVFEVGYLGLTAMTEQPGMLQQVGGVPPLMRPTGEFVTAQEAGLTILQGFNLRAFEADPRALTQTSTFHETMAAAGMGRTISVVAESAGVVRGILSLARKDPTPFGADEEAFLKTLAAMLAQAIEAQNRLRRVQTEAARQSLLSELAVLLSNGESIEAFFAILVKQLQAATPFDGIVLTVATSERGAYRVVDGLRRRTFVPGQIIRNEEFGENILGRMAAGELVVEGSMLELGGPMALAAYDQDVIRGAVAVIRYGAEVVGYLICSRVDARPFDEDERKFIELVSALLGQAIANLRKAEEKDAQARFNRVLNELALVVNDGQPVATHFERLCQLLAREGYEFCSLMARSPDRSAYRLLRSEPLPGDDGLPHPERFAGMQSAGLHSVQYGVDVDSDLVPAGLFETGVRRAATVVLMAGEAAQGLLSIGRHRPEPFTPEEMTFLELAGTLLAYAIENEGRIEASETEAEEQTILAEAAAGVARATTPLEISRAVRRAAARFIPGAFVTFGFLEPGALAFLTKEGPRAPLSFGPYFTRAFSDGQVAVPATADRIIAGENLPELEQSGVQAHLLTSAYSRGSLIGLLLVGSYNRDFEPGEREKRFCRVVANLVGPAMANARDIERQRMEAEEQRALAEVGAVAARETTPEQILKKLRGPLSQLIPQPVALFSFREPDAVIFQRLDGKLLSSPVGELARRMDAEGQIHGDAVPRVLAAMGMGELGIHALCGTVVRSAGAAVGYLMVGSRDPDFRFEERTLAHCRSVAQVVGPAMANARASLQARLDAEEQRFLAETAAAAARATNDRELIESLWGPFGTFIPRVRVIFYFLENGEIRLPGRGGAAFPISPATEEVLERGQVLRSTGEVDGETGPFPIYKGMGIASWVDTTVRSGAGTVGFLSVASKDPDYAFSERDQRLARQVADIIGPAMANLREARRREAELDEQRILAEAAASIAKGANEREIVDGLIRSIRAFIPRARVTFTYLSEDEQWEYDGQHRRPLGPNLKVLLQTGQFVNDLTTADINPRSRLLIANAGVHRWVDTVAYAGGATVGFLWVGSPEDHQYSERDLRMLRLIADVAGPAMVNARDEARRAAEAEDERLLSEVAALAARASDGADVVEALPGLLSPRVPGAYVSYGLVEGQTVSYQHRGPKGVWEPGQAMTVPFTAAGRAARETGQAVDLLANLPDGTPGTNIGLHQYVLTAYNSGGVATGMLFVATRDPEYSFDERTLALVRRVTQIVGPAVEASRAEAERTRLAELQALMLTSLSEGVILTNMDGASVFANPPGQAIIDMLDPADETTGWRDMIDRLPEDLQPPYRAVFERGEGARGRTRIEDNGVERWFDYEFVPLDDPAMKLLVVAADVTADVEHARQEERHREQMAQSQRLAALGELIAGVAHELNNPLTAILGFAEVMSMSRDAEPLAEDLGVIQKEAMRARNIVRDLLFIVRPGTSERRLIPVTELVGHIERLRRTAWSQQGVSWELAIQEPCLVWGNEHQLTQVLLNLVTNAEHALRGVADGRISVRARTSGGRTGILVADTGSGMPESVRSRIFEPFFTTKQGAGTGLGLSLSYSIIQSHDGEISVESSPGRGTTFRIVLPASDAAPPVATPATATNAKRVARVLVIDDEPSLRKVCQRLIASMGHECDVAENAAAAVELARANTFDVVLCDYRLATETANDVVEGLRGVSPDLINRVVIATGATTDPGVVDLTERYGLTLIAKPYGAQDLAAIIERSG